MADHRTGYSNGGGKGSGSGSGVGRDPRPEGRSEGRSERNAPAFSIRHGRIRAAVWANQNTPDRPPMYSVTLTRTFKDESGFRDTPSLGREDLLVASEILRQAYLWIQGQRHEGGGGDERGGE